MKGIGNYAATGNQPRVERKPATLVAYHGPRASIAFHDGTAYGMPSAALQQLALEPGQRFMMVVTWVGKKPTDVRIERIAEARPQAAKRVTPKAYVRHGGAMVTRNRLLSRMDAAIDRLAPFLKGDIVAIFDEWSPSAHIVVRVTGDPRTPRGLPPVVMGFPVHVRRGSEIRPLRR